MEEEYLKAVSKTIYQQLSVNKRELWAWGSKNFCYLERKVEDKSCPALIFTIRTPKVLRGGRVIISLDEGADEYIVEAIRIISGVEKLIGKQTGVFCDQLHGVINSLIEDKESYTKVLF